MNIGTKCLLIVTLLSPVVAGQQPEIAVRSIKLVDPAGQPVVGALADAWLVNEQFFWPSADCPRKLARSDAEGIAKVDYPRTFGLQATQVDSIKLTVSHPDFLSQDQVVPIGSTTDKPFEIKMKPGVSLTLAAVDQDGRPVTEPFAVLTTQSSNNPRWNRPSADRVQSRSLKNGNQQIMLIQPAKDKRHKYSDALAYRFQVDTEPEVIIDDIEIHPGVSVRGKLAANVPRPVMHGFVIATHLPLPAGDSWDDKLPSLIYLDSTEIREDGTFEFVSMPTTGIVQLIALCDGWVGLVDKKTPFTVGEQFDVDNKALDIELKMLPTFDAKIRILDQDGIPLENIMVACSPNQQLLKTGATWLGERLDSLPRIENQLRENPESAADQSENRFQAVSDKDGRAVIRNLPRGRWSTNFVAWPKTKGSIKIESPSNSLEGRLPAESENQVELEFKVKVVNK